MLQQPSRRAQRRGQAQFQAPNRTAFSSVILIMRLLIVASAFALAVAACGAQPQATPTTASSSSGPKPCGAGGVCEGEGERLPDAENWLGSVLKHADLDYRSNYRADGGGGHFVPSGQFLISALRPTESQSADEAAKYGHELLWSNQDTVVYGNIETEVWYFYFRAGNVDLFAETAWPPSRRKSFDELQAVFQRVIQAADRDPYPLQTPD